MAEDAAVGNRISPEELKKRYAEAKRLTSGVAFGVGNGELGTHVRDEVIRRNELRKEKKVAAVAKKGQKLRALCDAVRTIQKLDECQVDDNVPVEEAQPGDKKLPTLQDELLARWEETKGRPSPQVGPANSDDEGESDDDDDDGESDDNDGAGSEDDEASLGEEESESEEEEEEDAPSRGLEWGSDDEEESSESESESDC